VKPLAPVGPEFRQLGSLQIGQGVAFLGAGLALSGSLVVAGLLALLAAAMFWAFGIGTYPDVVDTAAPALPDATEPAGATWRRTLLVVLGTAVLGVGLAAVAPASAPVLGGATLGNGVAMWRTGRLLAEYQREHGAELLRRPGWRMTRRPASGDYYLA